MSDPTVCAILLTRDRPEYAVRAVECFRAQTYKHKRLQILDNSIARDGHLADQQSVKDEIWYATCKPCTIGALRNSAIGCVDGDIVIHLDDDDWSHPNRIAEQVALLQASGADCVGYREVLFWRNPVLNNGHPIWDRIDEPGAAYLYANHDPRYVIGSSMCYWRKAWEKLPFEDVNREEDGRWIKGVESLGISSFGGCKCHEPAKPHEPRMICRVHSGNAKHYPLDELVQASPNWKRVPEWDAKCRSVLS